MKVGHGRLGGVVFRGEKVHGILTEGFDHFKLRG